MTNASNGDYRTDWNLEDRIKIICIRRLSLQKYTLSIKVIWLWHGQFMNIHEFSSCDYYCGVLLTTTDNLWCFTCHHWQMPRFCGENIGKNTDSHCVFSVLKMCFSTGMNDFCIHFVHLLLLSIFRLWCNPEIIMPWQWVWWHLFTCFIH